jgi:hypothetical protein
MFNFKFNTKGFDTLTAKINAKITDSLQSNAMLTEMGTVMVERLKYQARIGAPFNDSGTLPPLKEQTMVRRFYLEQYNGVHPTYATNRSNLTITGAFLDSLTYKVTGPGKLEFTFEGNHPRYKGKNGVIGRKESKNSDIADGLARNGFKVFDKSINENRTMQMRMKQIALAYLRRSLNLK